VGTGKGRPLARWFIGTERGADVKVSIWGYQNTDGTIRERGIHVSVDGGIAVLDASGLRALAVDALTIADELDRHTS
jgi:hypothetical protein